MSYVRCFCPCRAALHQGGWPTLGKSVAKELSSSNGPGMYSGFHSSVCLQQFLTSLSHKERGSRMQTHERLSSPSSGRYLHGPTACPADTFCFSVWSRHLQPRCLALAPLPPRPPPQGPSQRPVQHAASGQTLVKPGRWTHEGTDDRRHAGLSNALEEASQTCRILTRNQCVHRQSSKRDWPPRGPRTHTASSPF